LEFWGAFSEHLHLFSRMENVACNLVRTLSELNAENLDALVIPGGESTTMALIAQSIPGFWDGLKRFCKRKPVWGTCAGLILLSEAAMNQKQGGQELLGVLPVRVKRNYFGAQTESFETTLQLPSSEAEGFPAVFIRAPVIDHVGEGVQVLANLDGDQEQHTVVAVRYGDVVATAFHPELTNNDWWHRYFAAVVRESKLRANIT